MTKQPIGKLEDYDRRLDGISMIAVSCRARTVLGRGLAAGAHLPFTHRDYGSFNSLAGFIRYLGGDRRDLNRAVSGVDYDDAVLDPILPHYEDVVQDAFITALTQGRGAELKLHSLLHATTLPIFLYQDVDGELIPVRTPQWYGEVLIRLKQRVPAYIGGQPKGLQWDPNELGSSTPTTPEKARVRSLKELQATYLRIHEGSDAEVDFWVSQAEYDSIPEAIRKAMGDALKIQNRIEGRHIPAPQKKIM